MEITESDVTVAKDQLIAELINSNLALRAQLAAHQRETGDENKENGKVSI